jgi:hypothetical protein
VQYGEQFVVINYVLFTAYYHDVFAIEASQ